MFVIYDGEALEKLEEQLLDIVESFGKSSSTNNELILKPVKSVTKNKYKEQIPLRKPTKSNHTGWVGMSAEKQLLSRMIDVQWKTEETLKILEEVALLDKALFFDKHLRFKRM